ncbi:MAG: sugar ABC transporter substrate-binding protein [Spirochaetota bacterium]
MKRFIFMLVALAILASAASAAPKTVKFAVWGLQEKATQGYFEQIKTGFEKANPGVAIEWVSYPYGQIKEQVLILSSAGEVPDLVQTDRAWLAGFAGSGFFAPVDTVMPKAYIDDVYPDIRSALTIDGKLWAAPWFYSPFVLYYNIDLFRKAGLDPAKPPKTYEEAAAAAVKLSSLKDQDGNQVYGLGLTTASVPVSGSYLLSLLYSFGGSLWDASGKTAANTPQTTAMLSFLKSAYEKKLNPEVAKLKDLRNLFGIGRLGMYFDQLWGISGAYAVNPKAKEWTAVAMPMGGNAGKAASTLEAHLLMVGVDSKVKPEVAKLVEYITSAEQLNIYQNINPFLVTRQTVNARAELIDPFVKPLAEAAKTIRPIPNFPRIEDQLLALATAAQSVTVGKAEPAAAAAELDKTLKTLK